METEIEKQNIKCEKKENKKQTGKVFAVLVAILLIIILGLLFRSCLMKADEDGLAKAVKAELGQLEDKSEKEIQEELDRVVQEGMFHISMNIKPVFRDGKSEGNLKIENVPGNRYNMKVVIRLAKENEEIYDSGLLYPNYHIQKDKLKKNLKAGVYDAVATFYAYEKNADKLVGTTNSEIKITVQN